MKNDYVYTQAGTDIEIRWRKLYNYVPASEQEFYKKKWADFRALCNQSIDDIWKSVFTKVDQMLYSSRMPAVLVKRFEERAKKELQEVDKRLSEYKRELYNELPGGCPVEGGVISDCSMYEFAFDDHKCVRKEKRKRNGIDY